MLKKTIICLLVLCLLLSQPACSRKQEDSADGQGYILTDYTLLPGSISRISRCFLRGERIYLCCREERDEKKAAYYAAAINTDGSGFERLPLELTENELLLDIAPGRERELWGLCMLPMDNDTASYSLCRFDSGGRELVRLSLDALLEQAGVLDCVGRDLFLVSDGEGMLCLTARDGSTSSFVFDAEGIYLFTLRDDSDPRAMVLNASGQAMVLCTSNGGGSCSLLPIDTKKRSWGEKIELGTAANVFSGGEGSEYYLFDSSCFFACGRRGEQREKLFNWSNLGLACGDAHVCPLPAGSFAVVAGSYSQTGLLSYEFCIVRPGMDERRVLSMLSLQPEDSLLEAIALFNKSNDRYRVELTSYFSKNEDVSPDDWSRAITRLNTELISGKIPDLMDLSNMPADAYARRGILEDLYPWLEGDEEISMEDYFRNVFSAMSIDGKLPYITSSVRIISVFADESLVEDKQGWTVEEFAALKNSGELKMEFFPPTLLLKLILEADDPFVDWEKGLCSYDSPDFARLLELCLSQAQADVRWMSEDGYFEGQANCIFAWLDSPHSVAYYNALLGKRAKPMGIPNPAGETMHILEPANMIGMSSACEHKEGAWLFVRSFLEPQLQESGWYFPYLRSSFEKICSEALKGHTIWIGGMYGSELDLEDIGLARKLLQSAEYCANNHTELARLVVDMSGAYFAGGGDATAAGSEIQSRARLYVGEHY